MSPEKLTPRRIANRLKRELKKRLSTVIKSTDRGTTKPFRYKGKKTIKKTFSLTPEGRQAFQNEKNARKVFQDCDWMSPIICSEENWMTIPRYPDKCRLDLIAGKLDEETRKKVAIGACNIILDMLSAGYAHRDFHSKNLFWIDQKQLVAIDFEWICRYEPDEKPYFHDCYDVTGNGLDSPYTPLNYGNMCYASGNPCSLEQVLKTPFAEALILLEKDLKLQMRDSTFTFRTATGRRQCRLGRIYGSFSLPRLSVSADEAQRDLGVRFKQYDLKKEQFQGRSVLDLGSNIGAMLFEIQKFDPGQCLGLEYDKDKVRVASRIAAYNDLNNVDFQVGDIEKVKAKDIGRHDIVFCLAIVEHMKDPDRLFRLLSEVTSEFLYFEGNSTTDPQLAKSKLLDCGFKRVADLGMCSDDFLELNNNRPLLIAEK